MRSRRRSAGLLLPAAVLVSMVVVAALGTGGSGVGTSAAAPVVLHPAAGEHGSQTPCSSLLASGRTDRGWVVWADGRNDPRPSDWIERTDIYGLSLATGDEVAICTGRGAQSEPVVCGDWVVWVDVPRPRKVTPRTRRLPRSRIVALDLCTGRVRVVCDARGRRWGPAISGSWVVWSDTRNATHPYAREAQSDLYAFDLATGIERAVCTARGSQDQAAISGDWVVWRDTRKLHAGAARYPEGDIYARDLAAGGERRLTSRTASCWDPDVCHGWAVWKSLRPDAKIRLVDLVSGLVTVVGDVWTGYFCPQISARWVVVQTEGDPGAMVAFDRENGDRRLDVPHESSVRPCGLALSGDLLVWSVGGNIAAYDLARGVLQTICTARGYQSEPAVWVP